jgi:hypothetical protein
VRRRGLLHKETTFVAQGSSAPPHLQGSSLAPALSFTLPLFIVHVRTQHSVLRKKRHLWVQQLRRGSSSLGYGGSSLSGCGADIRGSSSLGSGSSSLSGCCADIRGAKLLLQFANLLLQFANPRLRSSKRKPGPRQWRRGSRGRKQLWLDPDPKSEGLQRGLQLVDALPKCRSKGYHCHGR